MAHIGRLSRWLLLAGALMLVAAAFAQSPEPVRISGSFASSLSPSDSVAATFSCTGTPTCTGQYSMVIRDHYCSNALTFSDTVVITGLNLAQSGPIQGAFTFTNSGYSDHGMVGGVCTATPGVESIQYTGTFNASTATGSFNLSTPGVSGEGALVPGTFKTETAPPPVFPMVVHAAIDSVTATARADIQYRPQDVGTTGSVFVFAMAPASRVQGASDPDVMKLGWAKDAKKADTPIGCVLAQLNAAGQMVAVSSANLGAYLTGVLSAQGASVQILNGVPTSNVAGATFFVGYGSSGTAMINSGINRAAVTVPGSLECRPAAPQTGWWWNPAEDGRGFSIEKRGNNLFFASFLYDVSGRSNWYVSSGPVSLEGTLYNGDLLAASGGQTLGGPYQRFPTLTGAGALNLTFNNEATGTMVWPGGTVPIQRMSFIPNGLTLPAVPGVPESGWWWNENEAGRGFFLEFQGSWLDIAGYLYDDNGNPVWYLTVAEIGGSASARTFSSPWWSFTGGQTLTGAWRQNTRSNSNVAPLTISFTSPETAVMTLPNNRTTNLRRHRF